MADEKRVLVRIRRQERPESPSYWEEFAIPHRPNLNVIVLLQEIRNRPVTREGRATTPVAWESNCLEEVCGACSMVINGRPRQSCTALVDALPQPIVLEPMRTFPVIRDLMVDRSRMFDGIETGPGLDPDRRHPRPGPRPEERPPSTRRSHTSCRPA